VLEFILVFGLRRALEACGGGSMSENSSCRGNNKTDRSESHFGRKSLSGTFADLSFGASVRHFHRS
jgi:hypothetical protein